MLYRNLLLIVFFIGMALASPIKDKEEKKSEVSATVSLVPLETLPATNNDDEKNEDNEVIQFQYVVDDAEVEDAETGNVEKEEKEEEKEAEAGDVEKEEEKEEKEAEAGDVEKEEEKETEAGDVEKEEEKEADTEEVVSQTVIEEEEEPEIKKVEGVKSDAPENETIIVPEIQEYPVEEKKTNTCTKDLLIMGNSYATIDACADLYDACTTKELLSVILIFYGQETPVSMEYTIFDDMNKGHISEQCGNILINSKIFLKDTDAIKPIDEIPPVEKISDINQDIVKVTPAAAAAAAEDDSKPSDPFAFDGEEPIEDDSVNK